MSKNVRAGGAYIELGMRAKVDKVLQSVGKKLRGFGTTVAKLGSGIAASSAAMLTPLLLSAATAQETASKFDTVFGNNAETIRQWGNAFAKEVGRSRNQIDQFMASSQDLFVPLGFDDSSATEMSKTITQLSVDLASFNNKQDADVMNDLQAALTGSGEVMKKYGVILSEAAVKQELLNTGLDPKTVTEAQKATARLSIIMRGTTAAQGDAVRTSGSFTNQMKALRANASDLAVTIGTHLLPPVTAVVSRVNDAASAVMEYAEAHPILIRNLTYVAGAAMVFGAIVAGVGTAVLGAGLLMPMLATGLGIITGVLSAIAGPASLAIAAILAIGSAAYVYRDDVLAFALSFWEMLMPVREAGNQLLGIVRTTFAGVSDAITAGDYSGAAAILWEGIKAAFFSGASAAMDAFAWLRGMAGEGIAGAVSFAGSMWQRLLDYVWPIVGSIVNMFIGAYDAIQSTGASAIALIGETWNSLTGFVADVAMSIVDAFVAAYEFVTSIAGGITESISGAFSIAYDLVTQMTESTVNIFSGVWQQGLDVVGGIAEGVMSFFADAFNWVSDALAGLFENFRTTFGGIAAAIMSGNVGLAVEILWASIQLAFVSGIGSVKSLWSSFTLGLKEVWSTMASGIVSIFRGTVAAIAGAMQTVTAKLQSVLQAVAEYDPTGAAAATARALGTVGEFVGIAEDDLRARQAAAEDQRNREQLARGQAHLAELKAIADKTAEAKAKRDALVAEAQDASQGVTVGTLRQATLQGLEKQVAKAKAEASVVLNADKLAEAESEQEQSQNDAESLTTTTKNSGAGSFSALGAQLLGLGGGSAAEKTATNTEKTATNTDRMANLLANLDVGQEPAVYAA